MITQIWAKGFWVKKIRHFIGHLHKKAKKESYSIGVVLTTGSHLYHVFLLSILQVTMGTDSSAQTLQRARYRAGVDQLYFNLTHFHLAS